MAEVVNCVDITALANATLACKQYLPVCTNES